MKDLKDCTCYDCANCVDKVKGVGGCFLDMKPGKHYPRVSLGSPACKRFRYECSSCFLEAVYELDGKGYCEGCLLDLMADDMKIIKIEQVCRVKDAKCGEIVDDYYIFDRRKVIEKIIKKYGIKLQNIEYKK